MRLHGRDFKTVKADTTTGVGLRFWLVDGAAEALTTLFGRPSTARVLAIYMDTKDA